MPLRPVDLLRPHVGDVQAIVAWPPVTDQFVAGLQVAAGAEVVGPDEPWPAAVMGVLAVRGEVDGQAVHHALDAMPDGSVTLLLLGWEAPSLPFHRIVDAVVSTGGQVRSVAPLTTPRFPLGAVVVRSEVLAVPVPHLGAGHHPSPGVPADPHAERRLARRVAAELAFTALQERALRAALVERDAALQSLREQAAAAAAALAGARDEAGTWQSRATDAEQRSAELAAQLAALEQASARTPAARLAELARRSQRVAQVRRLLSAAQRR